MCRYCNYESDDNQIFIDPLINEYYLDIETMIWDSYNEDFFHISYVLLIYLKSNLCHGEVNKKNQTKN